MKSILKRFTESSKTYEFLVKFEVQLEQADNSSVASVGDPAKVGIPGELLEHKQDKKNLRNEAKYFWNDKLLEDKE